MFRRLGRDAGESTKDVEAQAAESEELVEDAEYRHDFCSADRMANGFRVQIICMKKFVSSLNYCSQLSERHMM